MKRKELQVPLVTLTCMLNTQTLTRAYTSKSCAEKLNKQADGTTLLWLKYKGGEREVEREREREREREQGDAPLDFIFLPFFFFFPFAFFFFILLALLPITSLWKLNTKSTFLLPVFDQEPKQQPYQPRREIALATIFSLHWNSIASIRIP